MRLTWADYRMTTTGTAVLFPDHHIKPTKPTKKRQKNQKFAKNVSYWARNGGGGHLGVTVFATAGGGGGGGGGHEKLFRKGDSFWRFPPLLPKRQKLSIFRKKFSCPPSRCEHSNTQMSPPVACPVRHLSSKISFLKYTIARLRELFVSKLLL